MNKHRLAPFTFCVLVAAVLTSCGGTKQAVVEEWMAMAPQHATKDFSGRLRPENWGTTWMPSYGPMLLSQTQAKLNGMFGDYELVGVVNDNEIVLFGLLQGVCYYTWHLTYLPKTDSIIGKQCDGFQTKKNHKCYNVSLRPEIGKSVK